MDVERYWLRTRFPSFLGLSMAWGDWMLVVRWPSGKISHGLLHLPPELWGCPDAEWVLVSEPTDDTPRVDFGLPEEIQADIDASLEGVM